MICKNCGKNIDDRNPVCPMCGTDYREKPICEHIYDKVEIYRDFKNCCEILNFWCVKCGHIEKIKCADGVIHALAGCFQFRAR